MRKRIIATLSTMLLAATIIAVPVGGATTPNPGSVPETGSGSVGTDQPDYDFEHDVTRN